jgi:hypothetical protein
MMLPNRSPILKRSIINSGRALPFSPSYNPAIVSSLFQNTAKTTAVTIADPVRVQSDLNGSIDAIAPSDAARPLYARSPKSGIRNLLVGTTTMATQSVTTTAVQQTLSFKGTGTVTLSGTSTAGPLVGTGANDTVSLTFTPTAGTLTLTVSGSVTEAQLELGAARTAYQRVGTTRADITESGVDSAFSLLFDGTDDYLDTGVQSFGSASLFADAGQQWAVAIALQTSLNDSRVAFAKASGTTGNQTFSLTFSQGQGLALRIRGATPTVIAGMTALNRYNAIILNWDGVTLNSYVNSLTPVEVTVGTATEEAQNILIGARTASSPAFFWSGRIGLLPLIDRSLTTAEIASVMRYLASESGAVIS